MNLNNIKAGLQSLNYYLNEDNLPQEIRNKQMQSVINELLQQIDSQKKEYQDIKELAWKLANSL